MCSIRTRPASLTLLFPPNALQTPAKGLAVKLRDTRMVLGFHYVRKKTFCTTEAVWRNYQERFTRLQTFRSFGMVCGVWIESWVANLWTYNSKLMYSWLWALRFRHPNPEWDGVPAAASGHGGLRHGLHGWGAEPRVQRLHSGEAACRLVGSRSPAPPSIVLAWQLSFVCLKTKKQHMSEAFGCLGEWFLTLSDISFFVPGSEVMRAGSRIS